MSAGQQDFGPSLKVLPEILPEPMVYLSEEQRPVVDRYPELCNVADELPCWVPARRIGRALGFSDSGIELALRSLDGRSYVWATEFENVHSLWRFKEPRINLRGKEHHNSESFFHAQKPYPFDAKVWDAQRVDVMREGVEAKFRADEDLQRLLLSTHPHPLLSVKADAFWGFDPRRGGANMLAKLLEELRANMLAKLLVGDTPARPPAVGSRDSCRQAAQRRVKKKQLKCGGCGELFDTSQKFQEHCMDENAAHDDDFAFDCSEVEVVYEAGDDMPEGTLDLTDTSRIVTFYNNKSYTFSNFYSSPIMLDALSYPTVEHAWQSLRFASTMPELAAKIRQAETADDAHTLARTDGWNKHRKDWDDAKYEILLTLLRAKFGQHAPLSQELLDTGDKMLVNVDSDQWAGMSAAGGIATGHNHFGKALMRVRAELRGEAPS